VKQEFEDWFNGMPCVSLTREDIQELEGEFLQRIWELEYINEDED